MSWHRNTIENTEEKQKNLEKSQQNILEHTLPEGDFQWEIKYLGLLRVKIGI